MIYGFKDKLPPGDLFWVSIYISEKRIWPAHHHDSNVWDILSCSLTWPTYIQNMLTVEQPVIEGPDALRETQTQWAGEGSLALFKDTSTWQMTADGWIIGFCGKQTWNIFVTEALSGSGSTLEN